MKTAHNCLKTYSNEEPCSKDVFTLLAAANYIDSDLATTMKNMVGFSNIAVHDYQTLQLPITVSIITKHLDDFLQYSKVLVQLTAADE